MKKFILLLLLLFAIVSLHAQDYLISFAGKGASTTVGTVKVENLTQNKSITLGGTEVLHLVAISTGINPELDVENALRIYPNPTTGNSTIEFVATGSGMANVELFDITGRRIGVAQNTLTIGTHSYLVSGLRSGIYTVRIYSQAYTYTSKLVSNGAPNSVVKISYNGNSAIQVTTKMLKSASTEKTMQYTTGDRLKYTGASGNYTTITTNIPTESKTLTFTFVPCTDAIGINYSVLQLGTQIWMGENLKTTKYRNGDLIPNVTDNTLWSNLRTGAYCDYDNRIEYSAIYGKLYNWHAINDSRNVAPSGWHVPTNVEWSTWTTFLGDENIGGKLKETGTNHWVSPNTGATNEVGFTALPGGKRVSSGTFGNIENYGNWWSSTEYSIPSAYKQQMSATNSSIAGGNDIKESGFSVRCVSDVSVAAGLPVLTTNNVSDILGTTATSGGKITSDGGANVTARGLCWSTSQNPTLGNTNTADGSGVGSFTSKMTGLTPNTTYFCRTYATNSVGTAYGVEISFKTHETVTDIDGNVYNTVIIGTQVWMVENLRTTKYNDGTSIPNVTTAWDNITTPGYCWYNNDIANKSTYGALYNWYAVNTENLCPKGWHVPTDAEWTTLTTFLGGESVAGGKLKETGISHWKSTNYATNETGFTALPGGGRAFNGTFYNGGYSGYWWSSTEDGMTATWDRSLDCDKGNVFRNQDFLTEGFSVRCLKGSSPSLNTTVVNITTTSATTGGNVTNDWGDAVTVRGVCWNTTGNPAIADNKTTDGTGTGSFTSNLTNLTGNTTYYVRAYATNSIGTDYGNQIIFKTSAGLATVTTSAVTGITAISAICGGNITNDGGAPVTERGICFSTIQNQTIATNKIAMDTGTGTYSISITGLNPNTTYYVRASATNSFGTSYGNEISFKTVTGTVTDIDGNVYNTVAIGAQVWMVENLKTTKYNDGTSIPNFINSTPGYCWYNNDVANKATYGALYNWHAVNTGKLAPIGWHVASDAEWTTLETYVTAKLGTSAVVKALASTTDWSSSTWAGAIGNDLTKNNTTGFTALPGGFRYNDGKYYGVGDNGYWWSSTEDGSWAAKYWTLSYTNGFIKRSYDDKSFGYSVRCIKD